MCYCTHAAMSGIMIMIIIMFARNNRHTRWGVSCREMILTCMVDLPARAAVCNMKGFNGSYSCATCLDSG